MRITKEDNKHVVKWGNNVEHYAGWETLCKNLKDLLSPELSEALIRELTIKKENQVLGIARTSGLI